MKLLFVFIAVSIFFYTNVFAESITQTPTKIQPEIIQNVLKKENRKEYSQSINAIINSIDDIYGNIHENLTNGKKIIIFFDTTHGKLPNGRWQGEATDRISTTGKTEELYSIPLARELYKLLSANKHIEIKTTPDYLAVLKGESETYNHIPFATTVKMAHEAKAFIIIAEHLNNVAIFHKASRKSNIPGFHIVHDEAGRKILRYIGDQYSGFLTLYNKLDASGFSKNYALRLRELLMTEEMEPNSWEHGAVGDDRFDYFVDFPVSVIYESGFISNPAEEKFLSEPENIKKIAKSQYNSLLDTIDDVFGVDIAPAAPVKTGNPENALNILKLARIAVFYIKHAESEKAYSVLSYLENNFSKSEFNEYLGYFTFLKWRISEQERYYQLGILNAEFERKYYSLYKKSIAPDKNKKQGGSKKYLASARAHGAKAHSFLWSAFRCTWGKPVLSAYYSKYSSALSLNSRFVSDYVPQTDNKVLSFPHTVTRASLYAPIILKVDDNESLEDAIDQALEPDGATLKKLVSTFRSAKLVNYVKVRKYSPEKKRKIFSWEKIVKPVAFRKGIYLVTLNKNLEVIRVDHVNSVCLNPGVYQNQQYLKNSYFSIGQRNKTL